MSEVPEGERRRLATEATLARYRGKAFDWGKGITCVHLARFHLRNMGHKPPSVPRFRSALAARKAMQERGWGSVAEMLDAVLPGARIAPVFMALGDLMVAEGEEGIEGIHICAGPRRVFGWTEGFETPVMIEPDLKAIVCWRV